MRTRPWPHPDHVPAAGACAGAEAASGAGADFGAGAGAGAGSAAGVGIPRVASLATAERWDLDTGFYVNIERRRGEVQQWMRAEDDIGGMRAMSLGLMALWRLDLRCHTSFGRVWKFAIENEWLAYKKSLGDERRSYLPRHPYWKLIGMNGSPIKTEVTAAHVLMGTIRECCKIVGEPCRRRWKTPECNGIRRIDLECMFRAAVRGQQPLEQIMHPMIFTERAERKPYCTIRLADWQLYWS